MLVSVYNIQCPKKKKKKRKETVAQGGSRLLAMPADTFIFNDFRGY